MGEVSQSRQTPRTSQSPPQWVTVGQAVSGLQVTMSAAVMESAPPHAGSNKEVENEVGENQDQLGDLVETMESVKLTESLDPEKIIKHPLQNAWTLWFFKNDKTRSWEDQRNSPGGRWMINLDKRQRADHLDQYWLEILFFLIGEHADQHAHQVNGVVVNVRGKGDKLAVWLADASQPDSILRIGKMIKERPGIDPEQTIGFNIHSEEKARPGREAKKKFYV